MAEGYTRAQAGNIGVCIGTSGPAGTDMITGLYSASADSIPILCITGQAPRARLYKEDFQAVDIESIAKPVTKWAVTVREPALVPRVLQQAFHLMRSGRPARCWWTCPSTCRWPRSISISTPTSPCRCTSPRHAQAGREGAGHAGRVRPPLIVAGGGVINADASALLVELAELTGVPVIPTLMGWGAIPDDHPLMAGMCGLQTSHRYGNATLLASDFVLGLGNRWANRHTGSVETYVRGRKFVHVDIEPTQIGRVFSPDRVGRRGGAGAVHRGGARAQGRRPAARLHGVGGALRRAQAADAAPDGFRQRADQAATRLRGNERGVRPRHDLCVHHRPVADRRRAVPASGPRRWINCGQAGPLGWTVPAALGVVAADPSRMVVGLSGDYDFQFMIEELAVGAQFNLPYVQVLVNNSYLGLIRQAQRGFDMDYCVQLAFENQNVSDPALQGYGVDHVQVIQGLGCKAIRVTDPGKLRASLLEAQALARQHRVPVVVEVILERVTNIAMGTEIDNIVEFEDIDCRHPEGAKGLAEAGLLA